jgi:anthranilate synthase/aminodeoxychorismate synthase-like glutamine amidotransferase
MILLIDNYDSFVHNLARYFGELGREREVVRNDEISLDAIGQLSPSHIVLSPGPGTPETAGVSNAVVERFGPTIPLLGVCLGHLCIGQVYGGRVVRAERPMHGKSSAIHHDGRGVFAGLESPMEAGRYHALVLDPESLPPALEITARSPEGEVMAVRHRTHPVTGLQVHPESILTTHGHSLLRNFLGGAP